ncbi:RDD family protein [Streptomyces sp. NPDC127084]|uniref:RDD family protein n=1 Tax=Streptomyces sp. NPDC127084 TaxID=3347133 RepID=UPI003654DB4B
MSAPTPATGDGSPAPGFYPDPSIPGYVRYWNGVAWVPGTSRPAPSSGAPLPAPPAGDPAASAAPAAPPGVPASPQAPHSPSLEETGPVFLDEDPAGRGPEPASAWQADASHQSGFGGDRDRRVSWGAAQDPRRDPAGAVGGPAASPEGPSAPSPAEAWSPAAAREARAAAAAGAAVPSGARFDRPVDPPAARAGADSAVDPSGGALPGMRSVGDDADSGEGPAPFPDASTELRAQQPKGDTAPAEGTMTIRTMTPQQPGGQRTRQGAEPRTPQGAPAAQAAQSVSQGPSAAPDRSQAQTPDRSQTPAQAQVPPQQQAPPISAGDGGGAASWAQQVHRLAQVQDPHEAERQPVTPWKPPVSDPFLQAAQAQAAARPAALGKRVVARLIDTVVLGAVVGAVAYPLVSRALTHIDEKIEAAKLSGETVTVYLIDATTGLMFGLALVALLLLGTLYEALPTAKWGRTLGKKLMGLDVRHIETHESPDFMAALVRWLVHGVLGVLLIGVVNVLWCVFDRPWRQCWHDKMAHTFVAGSPD